METESSSTLLNRIARYRWQLPSLILILVLVHQIIEHTTLIELPRWQHFLTQVLFYGIIGPVTVRFLLVWIHKRLAEKEQLERQVWARNQQIASLTTASPYAILSLDHRGLIMTWNHSAEHLFGYSAEDVIAHPFEKIFPRAPQITKGRRQTPKFRNFETQALTSKGHLIQVNITQSTQKADFEDVPESLLIIRDVTFRNERAATLVEERDSISRELHEDLTQILFFLALKTDLASDKLLLDDTERVRNDLREISQQTRDAIQDIRRLVFGLKTFEWSNRGFLQTLNQFVDEYAQQTKLHIRLRDELEHVIIPSRLEPTIFRIIQESLFNIEKHSAARTVLITLAYDGAQELLNLLIIDDGNGFKYGEQNRGVGLEQMEKRVIFHGGRFSIDSKLGEGTRVHVEIPLKLPGKSKG